MVKLTLQRALFLCLKKIEGCFPYLSEVFKPYTMTLQHPACSILPTQYVAQYHPVWYHPSSHLQMKQTNEFKPRYSPFSSLLFFLPLISKVFPLLTSRSISLSWPLISFPAFHQITSTFQTIFPSISSVYEPISEHSS